MAKIQLPADLEDFVSKEVASLCDADPPVLAQYIIALIGTEALDDNLKSKLQENLKDFFEGQTNPFIERLFAKIKGQDANTEQAASNKERFNDFSDEEDDGDRNFKHRRQRSESREAHDRSSYKRRLDDDSRDSSSTSKYQRSDDRRNLNVNSIPAGGYDRGGRGGSSRGMRGGGRGASNMNRGQSRPQCRDYNERGFCMRGDLCPYDHGTDRIIVDESAGAFAGAPFASNGPMAPMGGRGPQPFFGMPGVPDAYDPERAGLMPPTEMTGFLPGSGMLPNDMMGMNNNMMRGSNGMHRGGRGGGRGMGRGRGGYHNRPYHNQNQNPLNTTLNVEKIPAEFCQISTVNDFFAKFGTITNISVLPHMQKAVIQYSTRAEAENAYNSPDAIFDNRFVKVYWAKEEPAANAASPAAATDGSQLAAAPKVNEPDPELVKARAAELAKEKEEKLRKHKEHLKRVLEIQKKKETLLQQQIDEQKRLLAKLSDTANMSKAEKSELLNALKRIQSDIDTSKSTAAAAAAVDAEAPTSALEGGVKETVETAEDLKKKLARLEAEAAAIGVPGSGFRGGRGGYYGRGRGSWPRMRGGMTRMTLDNRPTKIIVKDIPQDSTEPELRQHFEQFGNVTLFEQKDSGVVVQYGARFEAEKAMAAGPNYAKGTLQVAWSNEPTASTATTTTTNEGA